MARELEIKITADIAQAVDALRNAERALDEMGDSSAKTDKEVVGLEKDVQGLGKVLDDKVRKLVSVGTAAYALQKGFAFLANSIKLVGGVALDMNANLETSTMQFTTLMGDAGKAEKHVRSLFEFAKNTPFETEPIIKASKQLELFGGAALNNERMLRLLGDASAASGAQFEELAFWTGRMYTNIQAGKPFGEAALRLQELGVLTPIARQGIENLAASGTNANEVFGIFEDSLTKFTGAMAIQANTWDGLTSTIKDSVQITIADALEPFFELVKTGAQIAVQVLGSAGLQKTLEGVSAGIGNAFGNNSVSQVKVLMLGIVSFADAVVFMGDVSGRVFYALKLAVQVVMQSVAEFLSISIRAIAGFTDLAASVPVAGQAFESMNRTLQDQKLFMQGVVEESRRQTSAAYDGVMGNSAYGKALDGARAILGSMRTEIAKATVQQNAVTAATNSSADAMARLTAAAELNPKAVEKARKEWEKFNTELDKFNEKSSQRMSINKVLDFGDDPYIKAYESQLKFENSVKSFTSGSRAIWEPFKEAATKAVDGVQSRFSNFKAAFEGLGPAIVGAIQGGGSVGGTIGAVLGQGLGKDLGNGIARMVSGTVLGPTIGKALGSLGGPLGAIVGQLGGELAGKLFGKLFGNSQQKAVTDMRNKFFELGGGVDAVRERANAAGVSMDKLFTIKNAKDMEAAIKAFNAQLKAAEEAAAKAKEELAKMNTEMGTLLKEADTLGVVLPESLQLAIDKLIESGQLTEENRTLLEGLGAGSKSQFKAMEDAAKKYGVELAALGPAFNQNKINETAADIIGSFDTMVKGGADVNAVIAGMSDEINQFLANAIKTGSTVPENLRPILDAMLAQGKLTDENGRKLTELGNIKFGAPIETAIDKLIAKITELVEKMSGGLDGAFKNAERSAQDFARNASDAISRVPSDIRVRFSDYDTDAYGFDKGGVAGRDYRPPSSRDIIPALLRPGEVVLTPEQARAPRAGGPAVNVVINVAGYLDSPTARTGLADIVRDELSKNLRRVGRAA